MYKYVNSIKDLQTFHQIKKVVWDEKGFEMEYAKEGSDLFLLMDEEGEAGGTIEFTPYSKTRDFMRDVFDNSLGDKMHVMEWDSGAVLPKFRGKLGRNMVCLMVDYAERYGYTHVIGIYDPRFFNSVKNKYKFEIEQIDKEFYYKGDYVIPAILNVAEMYNNKKDERFSWYVSPVKDKEAGGIEDEKLVTLP
ncbi:N-acetyltransferase [Bacillus pseudomycoides]|nr:N-acetyltransferase [Bacillus pseudomycoides]